MENNNVKLKFDLKDLVENLRIKLNNAEFENSQLNAVISLLSREIKQKDQKIKELEAKPHAVK